MSFNTRSVKHSFNRPLGGKGLTNYKKKFYFINTLLYNHLCNS